MLAEVFNAHGLLAIKCKQVCSIDGQALEVAAYWGLLELGRLKIHRRLDVRYFILICDN